TSPLGLSVLLDNVVGTAFPHAKEPAMRLSRFPALAFLFLFALSTVNAGTPKEKGKPKFTNRLAKETSPYLLMHAHNPTNWYAWGPEAFEKAKKEKKLI